MLVSLYGNTSQTHALPQLARFLAGLRDCGLDIETESNFARWLMAHSSIHPRTIVDAPSTPSRLIVSFGGDGTFLHAVRWQRAARIPIAGVNTGHLGYLAPWSLDEAPLLAHTIATPNPPVERRTMLQVAFPDETAPLKAITNRLALNEVALQKENSSSMISVRTMLDDTYLTDYLADGLVIATPTGSTAYSLSAGGPIMQPTAPAIVLTPIAPHTLTMRPLVIEDNAVIRVIPTTRTGRYMLSLDGIAHSLPSGTPVEIRKSPRTVSILRHPGDDFATTLRTKLLWGTHTIRPATP